MLDGSSYNHLIIFRSSKVQNCQPLLVRGLCLEPNRPHILTLATPSEMVKVVVVIFFHWWIDPQSIYMDIMFHWVYQHSLYIFEPIGSAIKAISSLQNETNRTNICFGIPCLKLPVEFRVSPLNRETQDFSPDHDWPRVSVSRTDLQRWVLALPLWQWSWAKVAYAGQWFSVV